MRSYYDVYNELTNPEDKIKFIEAVFNKQFHNRDIELKGMARFAYVSQMHHIESSVKGYEYKTKIDLRTGLKADLNTPPTIGGAKGAKQQEEEQEQEEYTYRKFKHLMLSSKEFKRLNTKYSKDQIDEVLDAIENYKLNKKYASLNLTAQAWLKKRHPNQKEAPKEVSEMTDQEKLKNAMGTL